MAAVGAISLVLFDMDDVVCDYSRDARVAALAEMAGCSAAEVYAAIFESGFEAEGDAGSLDSAAYLAEFGRRIGYPLSLDEWIEARRAGTRARPEMLDLVRRLRVPAAILTNNSLLVTDHIDRIAPELRGVFGAAMYASAGFKAAKPDAACFHRCLGGLGVPPGQALFIDDLQENVDGAMSAGLTAYRYVSVAGVSQALQEHGLLAPRDDRVD